MSADRGNGNGDDPGTHRKPLHLVSPRPGAQPYEVAARATDAIVALQARVNEIDTDVIDTKIAVISLGRDVRDALVRLDRADRDSPTPRDPDASWHDYDAEWEKARQAIRARVKDPTDRDMTSDRAMAIAQEAVARAATDKAAGRWQAFTSLPGKAAWKAVEVLISAAVGGGAVYLWHLLSK